MRIECGPCVIRPWQTGDLESLVANANNRSIWLRLRDTFPHPYTTESGEWWLNHVAAQPRETHFAVDVDGSAIGAIGYEIGKDIERCQAEVGYWLGEPYWRRGIATAAITAFTQHVFESTDLIRLFATPFCDNLASRRALVKAGWQLEGTLRQSSIKDGKVMDRALYVAFRNNPDADFF
ncbi:MAG: GNAT family N-acetyltransferase [Planctomycetaceae bacterium]